MDLTKEKQDAINSLTCEAFGLSAKDAEFLVDFCLMAFEQKFDIDKVVGDKELKFGFAELPDLVTSFIEEAKHTTLSSEEIRDQLQNNLIAIVRDEDIEAYKANNLIEEDRELFKWLTEEPKEEGEDELTKYIKSSNIYNSLIMDTMHNIKVIYDILLADSFGLNPYKGVFVLGNHGVRTLQLSDLHHIGTAIENASGVFTPMNTIFEGFLDVEVSLDRQFNVKDILDSSKPIYYPYKFVEYAAGLECCRKIDKYSYKKHSNTRSFLNVEDKDGKVITTGYFNSWIEEEMYNLCVKVVYLTIDGLENKESSDVINRVKANLSRFLKSVCCAICITEYNNLGGKVNKIALRLVDINASLTTDLPSSLFNSLTTNKFTDYSNDTTIISELMKGEIPAFKVFEYKHDFDEKLSGAEPLFGYKAVELYNQRGMNLSWDRILLGQDAKGTPIFASATSAQDIPLQSNTVHNMMAGSRSGKGVMTMNILASAIASNKPIFYIDRKPDMAVMFWQLTGGNMFIINGGQYEKKNDPEHFFMDGGSAIAGWQNKYDALPNYVKSKFFSKRGYENSDFADMVYYRAMMFIFGILMARVECPELINELGGENGIVAIFDEFKNWQVGFESTFFTVAGKFGNGTMLTFKDEEEYKKLVDDLKMEKLSLNLLQSDPKKALQAQKAELKIQRLEEKLAEIVRPESVYATTIMQKYGESVKHMGQKFSAGFKDKEGMVSDIFVIGQHIEIEGYYGESNPNGLYSVTASGAFNNNETTKGKSLMRGLLNNFPKVDWFMGYNQDGPQQKKYCGADSVPRAKRMLTERQYWCYSDSTSQENLRQSEPSSCTYFKPYLVLNNANEDDPASPCVIPTEDGKQIVDPRFTFVSQCRSRVNNAVPGANLWEQVRLKHLPKEFREEAERGINKHYGQLNEGIGFEGLIHCIDSSIDLTSALKQSAVIADMVASRMGYANYKDLLFDLSPEAIFSTVDIINALKGSADYFNKEKRLPLFAKYGLLDEGTYKGSADVDMDSEFVDDSEPIDTEESYFEDDDYSESSSNSTSTSSNITQSSYQDAVNRLDEDDEEPEPIHTPIPNTEPKYISVMDVMHFCNLCVAKMGISIADLNAVECAQKTALDSLVAMGYTIK